MQLLTYASNWNPILLPANNSFCLSVDSLCVHNGNANVAGFSLGLTLVT